jgi:hypothetical protein
VLDVNAKLDGYYIRSAYVLGAGKMRTIDNDGYLQCALVFTEEEKKLLEIHELLPDKIIDCHAHCFLSEHADFKDAILNHPASTFSEFNLEQSRNLQRYLYPGHEIIALRFPIPIQGVDFRKANKYLLENASYMDRVAVCGIVDDIAYTTDMLNNKHVSALKMYNFSIIPSAEKIYDFFKPEILEHAQSLGVPIILHPPKPIDIGDDFWEMLNDFPGLKVIFAHLGAPTGHSSLLEKIYAELSKHEQVYMDTSLATDYNVAVAAFRFFDPDRIVFGSDEPCNLIRARIYMNPCLGKRLITEYPYHWADPDEHKKYSSLAKGCIHLHWQALRALMEAIKDFFPKKRYSVMENVFCNTAKKLFSF